ncbi:MAG: hypothetical protein WC632_00600 [Candidatus Margulisiibacteriota bacterium]
MKKNIIFTFALIVLLAAVLAAGAKIGHAALVVNTNTSSLNAQRALSKTQLALQTSFNRLSSGDRLDSASDDAEGLGIAEKQKAAIEALDRSSHTVADTISLLQTSDEILTDTANVLIRVRSLGLRAAANRRNAGAAREDEDLAAEMDRISQATMDISEPGMELVIEHIDQILKDLKATVSGTTPKVLTERQYLAKIDAHLGRIAKDREELAAYAAKIDAAAQKVLADAGKNRDATGREIGRSTGRRKGAGR